MKRDELHTTGMALAPQQICLDVLRERYLRAGEHTADQVFARVARALASVEKANHREEWEALFLENMHRGAIGAGRILSAAGTDTAATLINCFVQPVGNCTGGFDEEGFPGLEIALQEAKETMRRGGGVGYDFSRVQPKDAAATSPTTLGPCAAITRFDQTCSAIKPATSRRCAQMGVLGVDHPDILEFVTAKRTPDHWSNFNVSVAVTDLFMQAVEQGQQWDLVHKSAPAVSMVNKGVRQREDGLWIYQTLAARELWNTIMQSAYAFAEPGILFLDQINRDNNLRYCEKITATNPCGEAPLPPYGCCDLGPIILTEFVRHPFGFQGSVGFDYLSFEQAVKIQVRALDNVLDLTPWPLPRQREEAMTKRRIGVGFTGLGNTLTMLGLRYDRRDGRVVAAEIAKRMRNAAYEASTELAKEKGAFPKFNAEGFLAAGTFASRLSAALKDQIRRHGIRNSHLLSIAPAGTVSLAFADNASNGIEPAFSWSYLRKKRESDGATKEYMVEDHAWRVFHLLGGHAHQLPESFVSALGMSASDHVAMMRAVQPFIDSAISKTVNVPGNYPYQNFEDLYFRAWKSGLKGLTTYRPNAILGAVLESSTKAKTEC